jgi:PAS domain S-box-containing protein
VSPVDRAVGPVTRRAIGQVARQIPLRMTERGAAKEREAIQAQILSQVTDAVVVLDRAGLVHTWNAGAERIFGRASADAVGRPVSEAILHRRMRTRAGNLRAAISGAGEWRGDAEVSRPGRDRVFVEGTVRAITDEAGVPAWHLIVAHDVDTHRREEREVGVRAVQQAVIATLGQQALAGMEFQRLVDQTAVMLADTLHVPAVAICELADKGTSLLVRAAGGWTQALPGTRFSSDPAQYPACVLAPARTAAEPRAARARRVARHPIFEQDGIRNTLAIVIPCQSSGYGILIAGAGTDRKFSSGDKNFMQAVANVIGTACERHTTDHELRAELSLYSATLESSAEGILVTDVTGRVSRYNQRMVEMWGVPPGVVASTRVEDWIAFTMSVAAEPDLLQADFRRASTSDLVDAAIITLKNGRVFERHSQPQRVDRRIVGRVWSYRDITERVRAEEQRRAHETQMQHVQKLESLGVLAGGIAHDFNNLLVSMLGNAALALTDIAAESPAHERLMQIETAAQRAAELTGQMLAYSGKGRFVIQRSDLSQLVEELASLLRAAVAKTAALDMRLARDLPAFDGDAAQIRQVIMNLITNAADAIGGAPGRIQITTGRMHVSREYLADACVGRDLPEGEFVFAEVADNGCGMDRTTLNRMFDPFFTTKYTGRGLGLAAVLGIVRGHRGAITLTSTPGEGTCFRVLLPASPGSVQTAAAPAPQATCVTDMRVLIVDDEEGVRRIAGESLRRAGFEVVVAGDGVEAVALIRGGDVRFDAMLLDMTMPRMSGVETCAVIKGLLPDLPVIVTSGYSEQDAASRFEVGAIAGFIQKPFLPSALVRMMQDAVRREPLLVAAS